MGLQDNNITIFPVSGYSPSFSWQVGFADSSTINTDFNFRATIRALHGLENYTRVPSDTILYEETGILVNNVTNQGQWTFPLETNASLTGGPYRDYQVVIEAHDSNGNTSAGNVVDTTSENGWTRFNNGYDIIAVSNPRQTGIELGHNIPTQYTNYTGYGDTGFYLRSGNGYSSLNYMESHGGINIRYLNGSFNSNLVGGYLYVWTGVFPKREAALSPVQIVSGYNGISVTQFDFNPDNGYIDSSTAAMSFRGANQVYVSVSFYDNIDQIALENGNVISTGLYISDNAICYNDMAAGSISIGGFQTIYSMQYTGNAPATGILGTGISILASQYYNGQTSVLYLANPVNTSGLSSYSGIKSMVAGGAGGMATLLNDTPITDRIGSFILKTSAPADDSTSIYLNDLPIKDTNNIFNINPDSTTLNVMNYAALSGYTINIGDKVSFSGKDIHTVSWTLVSWTGIMSFSDGTVVTKSGGTIASGPTDFIPHYRDNGFLIVSKT